MEKHSLTDEQIEQYRNEGFLVVERLFDADDLVRVDRTIREMTDAALKGGEFSKVLELEPEPVDGQHGVSRDGFSARTISTTRSVIWLTIRGCSTGSSR